MIQQIGKFGQIRELYINFRISKLHYNIDIKRTPVYCPLVQGVYIIYIHALYKGHIYDDIAFGGGLYVLFYKSPIVVFWSKNKYS